MDTMTMTAPAPAPEAIEAKRVIDALGQPALAALLADAAGKLAALHAGSRARVRLLTAADIEAAVRAMAAALTSDPEAERASARIYGGFVPNSYNGGYGAETDHAELAIARTGEWSTRVWRGGGCNRSHGMGNACVIRVARPGQVAGRVL